MNRRDLLALGSASLLGGPALASASSARTILTGGPIHTGVAGRSPAEAIAIEGSRVVAIGSLRAVRAALPRAKEIDLAGAAALPGLVDSHAHMTGIGLREMTLNLDSVKSIAYTLS